MTNEPEDVAIDVEIKALTEVYAALVVLPAEVRTRVVEYVTNRLEQEDEADKREMGKALAASVPRL